MKKNQKNENPGSAFELINSNFLPSEDRLHIYGNHVICITDSKGSPNPKKSSRLEIVVDATDGFIPLWDKGVTLNWRFSSTFGNNFKNPRAAKSDFKKLIGEAILAWKDACPVKFMENNDTWDFEVTMAPDACSANGCVLASAFFPMAGREKLTIHPKMFTQARPHQIATLVHELGHVFGLRHFFAKINETKWKSEIFGAHKPFSIMNYGDKSVLTNDDINDLKRLYQLFWSGKLKEINGTRIQKFKSFHMSK
jgi:hypothetical protein